MNSEVNLIVRNLSNYLALHPDMDKDYATSFSDFDKFTLEDPDKLLAQSPNFPEYVLSVGHKRPKIAIKKHCSIFYPKQQIHQNFPMTFRKGSSCTNKP
jgi:hypothetical protein